MSATANLLFRFDELHVGSVFVTGSAEVGYCRSGDWKIDSVNVAYAYDEDGEDADSPPRELVIAALIADRTDQIEEAIADELADRMSERDEALADMEDER